jgi:hypothetical protein
MFILEQLIDANILNILFPNGVPTELDSSRIIEITPDKEYGYYRLDKIEVSKIKKAVKNIADKNAKLSFIKGLSSVLIYDQSKEHDDKTWGRGFLTLRNVNSNTRYRITFSDAALSFSDLIDILGDVKPTKAFLRSILGELVLVETDKPKLLEYLKQDKLDIFRVIGKGSGLQFTKSELLEIIALPEFTRKTTSGLIGGQETADIVNRRAVILHQDETDEEVIMEVINTISDAHERERFFISLNKKSTREKYEKYPSIQVLLKLM